MAIPTLSRPASVNSEAPAQQGAPISGAQHLCLDIETGHASQDAIELTARFYKHPPAMKDPKKIAAREIKEMAKIQEKSALLDGAPIYVVGALTEANSVLFHHIQSKKKIKAIENIPAEIYAFKSEREMLGNFRDWANPRALPNTVLIGHNIRNFDLPKLRGGFIRNRILLPQVLRPEAKDDGVTVHDTMRTFLYGFTTEKAGDKYISQEEMVARLGMPGHKHRLSGAEIPRMIAEGKAEEVLAYNYLDVAEAYGAFLAMTGQYKDEQKN